MGRRPLALALALFVLLAGSAQGATVTGQVADESGAPIAGARVSSTDGRATTTGPDGTYVLTGVAGDGQAVLFAGPPASDFVAEYYDDADSEADAARLLMPEHLGLGGVDARLADGGRIQGTVVEAQGTPVAGVEVSATPIVSGVVGGGEAVTDDQGRYTIHGLRPGRHIVSFDPPGAGLASESYSAGSVTPVAVVARETTPGIDAELLPRRALLGTVTGPSGPVAGVTVDVFPAMSGRPAEPIAVATTDAHGRYATDPLDPGLYKVGFEAPASAGLATEFSFDEPTFERADPVLLGRVEDRDGVDAVLERTARIRGLVTAGGGPLAGVHVIAFSRMGGPPSSTTTASDGRFVFSDLRAGGWILQMIPPAGSVYFTNTFGVRLSAGEERDVEAGPLLGGLLTGVVRGPGGAPLPDVRVTADSPSASGEAVTDSGGRYRMAGLAPNAYRIRFDPPEGSGLAPEFFEDAPYAEAGDQPWLADPAGTSVDATLGPAGSIEGTVTGAGGGIARTTVELRTPLGITLEQTFTDHQGGYRFARLAPGPYLVRTLGAGPLAADEAWVTVGSGATVREDVLLPMGAAIRGSVLDEDGQPVANVKVRAHSGADEGQHLTTGDGSFEIAGLDGGSYTLRIADKDHAPVARTVVVAEGEVAGPFTLTLSPGASVAGQVTAADGPPLAGALVEVLADGEPVATTQTGPAGFYRVGELDAGEYVVRFAAGGEQMSARYKPTTRQVTVPAGGALQDVDAELGYPGTIGGTVFHNERPLERVAVEVFEDGTRVAETQSDLAGAYDVDVPTGTYLVRMTAPGHAPKELEVVVSAPLTTTADVEIGAVVPTPTPTPAPSASPSPSPSPAPGGPAGPQPTRTPTPIPTPTPTRTPVTTPTATAPVPTAAPRPPVYLLSPSRVPVRRGAARVMTEAGEPRELTLYTGTGAPRPLGRAAVPAGTARTRVGLNRLGRQMTARRRRVPATLVATYADGAVAGVFAVALTSKP